MEAPYWCIGCFIAILCFAQLTSVVGECHKVSFQEDVKYCLRQLYDATGAIKHRFDTDVVKMFCNESSAREIQCVRNIRKECSLQFGQNVSDAVDRFVDVNTIQNVVDTICKPRSTAALDAAKDCLREFQARVKRCTEEKEDTGLSNARSKTNEFDRYDALCATARETKQCYEPYIKHCSRDVQPVFEAVALLTTPAVCSAFQITHDVYNCVKGANHLFSGTLNTVAIRNYCYSTAASAVQCAKNAVNKDQGLSHAVRDVYQKSFDINTYSDNLTTVCNYDNVAALMAAKSCLNRYESNVKSCIQEKGNSGLSDVHSATNEEDRYKAICDTTRDIRRCYDPYRDNCGRAIWPVLDALVDLVTPPRCPKQTSRQGSSAGTAADSPALLSLTMLILVQAMNF